VNRLRSTRRSHPHGSPALAIGALLGLATVAAVQTLARPALALLSCSASATSAAAKPTTSFLRGYWASLRGPVSVAADGGGSLFIADAVRSTLTERRFDGSVAREIRLPERPLSVGTDGTRADGPVYVGDASGQVRAYARDFSQSSSLGAGIGEFAMPADIAVDPLSGQIWIADARAKTVGIFSPQGARLQTLAGASAAERFGSPTGLAVLVAGAIQEVLVADQPNSRLLVFGLDGAYRRCIGRQGGTPGRFAFPKGLATDRAQRIYVSDTFQGDVQVIDRNGGFLATVAGFGERPGELRSPADLAIDTAGRLYVATTNNQRLDVFGIDAFSDPESVIPVDTAALPDVLPPHDGTVTSLRIQAPGTALAGVETGSITVNGIAPTAVRIEDTNRDGALDILVDLDVAALLPTLPAVGDGLLLFSARLGAMTLLGSATVSLRTLDDDVDGIRDAVDGCPGSAPNAVVDTAGCSIAQLCPCQGPWSNHGAYVTCVKKKAIAFQNAGWIPQRVRQQLIADAAQSRCGGARGKAR
jgi:DNA-binding beta-propeller fold protein YncE